METDYNKTFFQNAWGELGYYETFSYGVGIDKVCVVALYPFCSLKKRALEIGSGGGTFTERMISKFEHLTAIDVISMPAKFNAYQDFTYIELPSRNYNCEGMREDEIDFTFSYNVFCHLSNDAIKKYISSVYKVLKKGGDFVFMISDVNNIIEPNKWQYKLGEQLPMGHYYQNHLTIDLVTDFNEWEVVNRNLIPEHRDIIIHLKKK